MGESVTLNSIGPHTLVIAYLSGLVNLAVQETQGAQALLFHLESPVCRGSRIQDRQGHRIDLWLQKILGNPSHRLCQHHQHP